MEQKTKNQLTIDRDSLQVSMSRLFNAPRDLVYQVSTDPQRIDQWWGPASLTSEVERYDVQEGGRWRILQRDPDGNVFAFHGEFREVTPPERLVFTFIYEGAPEHVVIETITYEDVDGKTLMTTTDQFPSLEALDGMVASGMESGANETMNRLAQLVE